MRSKNMTFQKKMDKLVSDIRQLEKTIAENQKKLSDLKEAKIEAENAEIISLIRNAELSVDDISDIISHFKAVTKPTANSLNEKSTGTAETIPETSAINTLKGFVNK